MRRLILSAALLGLTPDLSAAPVPREAVARERAQREAARRAAVLEACGGEAFARLARSLEGRPPDKVAAELEAFAARARQPVHQPAQLLALMDECRAARVLDEMKDLKLAGAIRGRVREPRATKP